MSTLFGHWKGDFLSQNYVGSAVFLPEGGEIQALSNFGGSFLFMCIPFVTESPNWTWWHIWGGVCI